MISHPFVWSDEEPIWLGLDGADQRAVYLQCVLGPGIPAWARPGEVYATGYRERATDPRSGGRPLRTGTWYAANLSHDLVKRNFIAAAYQDAAETEVEEQGSLHSQAGEPLLNLTEGQRGTDGDLYVPDCEPTRDLNLTTRRYVDQSAVLRLRDPPVGVRDRGADGPRLWEGGKGDPRGYAYSSYALSLLTPTKRGPEARTFGRDAVPRDRPPPC